MTYSGIQSRPGTYALLLSSAADAVIQIGRLGDLRLQPGYTSMSAAHSGREASVVVLGITCDQPTAPTGTLTISGRKRSLKPSGSATTGNRGSTTGQNALQRCWGHRCRWLGSGLRTAAANRICSTSRNVRERDFLYELRGSFIAASLRKR
jgi:hypothetical protein